VSYLPKKETRISEGKTEINNLAEDHFSETEKRQLANPKDCFK
jgi:lipase chaperone LimK